MPFKKLALWYNTVEDCGLDSFKTVARSIQKHYLDILNRGGPLLQQQKYECFG